MGASTTSFGTDDNFCDAGLSVDFDAMVDGRYQINTRSPGSIGYYIEQTSVVNVFTDQATGQAATDIEPNKVGKDQKIWQTLTTNGRLTAVVWSSLPSPYGDSLLMARVQDGRVWSPPRRIAQASSRMWFNAAAFAPDGSLRVVWIRNQGEMRTRVREPGGTWGPQTRITYVGLDDYRPVVVAYGDRRAAVVSTTRSGKVVFAELSQ